MPSEARKTFDENRREVWRLAEIHTDLTGEERGRRTGVEVLHKSAIVLMCAAWEAYCEDLALEAGEHLRQHAPTAKELPKKLRRQVSKELETDANELAVWGLADDGWRGILRARTRRITEERNSRLNTPKTENIDELFADVLGLQGVSKSWYWPGMTHLRAAEKLDEYVTLRGDVAHRVQVAGSVRKAQVQDFVDHAGYLVRSTDGRVNGFLREEIEVALF